MRLLGIDVGTGGTRAVVVDEAGAVVASATAEHAPFASPRTGWAEQDPRDWWRATAESVRAALAKAEVSGDSVACVGFSGQMHGSVLLDEGGEVLRPALIWCDQRTDSQCRSITERVGSSRLVELTSNPALTGFTLPKLLWVREQEPELWARVRTVLLPKDYARFRLTGERATDVADASGTLLFDVASRRWSEAMLDAAEIDRSLLPAAFESPEITGRVSAEGAAATGLRAGTPVVAGAGDQAAGAVGMGIVRAGAVSATIGTSGVVFAATSRPALDLGGRVHTFCHAVPGRWHVMGVTQAAGLSLRWFRDRFGVGDGAAHTKSDDAAHAESDDAAHVEEGRDPYDLLCEEAAAAPPGSDGVLWAPYLMGERTPHLDPRARAALVGLAASHTRAHVVRAILEGVAFSLRDTLTIFEEMRVPVETIRLGGGGARSSLWRQIQADVYGRAVEILAAEEGAAYGAALLAGVGGGVWPSVDEACARAVCVAARVEPDADASALLNRRYGSFRALYPALRAVAEAGDK
ncbi:MAG TPA: xylulokinase [Pyrinomonadaceae bacterium]|nr:xylulokinase [Pyrinomonadaceae bacterium]